MTKIKVNINKPDPSQEVIARYKPSYEGFLQTYQKLHTSRGISEMMYRDKVKLSMIVVFLMLLLLFVLSDANEKEEQKQEAPTNTGRLEYRRPGPADSWHGSTTTTSKI